MSLMKGKKGLIMGVANERSIAWGISQKLSEAGAELAFTYLGDALKKRVVPLAEKLNSNVTFSCDVEKKEDVIKLFEDVKTQWGEKISFQDNRLGWLEFEVGKDFSDFLVWRKDGFSSYELATVVDDQRMKISEVVRGEDLLVSSARQCLIFDAMGWARPKFYHCKLFLDAAGKKLSKSKRCLQRLFTTP